MINCPNCYARINNEDIDDIYPSKKHFEFERETHKLKKELKTVCNALDMHMKENKELKERIEKIGELEVLNIRQTKIEKMFTKILENNLLGVNK